MNADTTETSGKIKVFSGDNSTPVPGCKFLVEFNGGLVASCCDAAVGEYKLGKNEEPTDGRKWENSVCQKGSSFSIFIKIEGVSWVLDRMKTTKHENDILSGKNPPREITDFFFFFFWKVFVGGFVSNV